MNMRKNIGRNRAALSSEKYKSQTMTNIHFDQFLMCGHNNHFRGGVFDLKFTDHRGRVRRQEQFLNVILDDFVHSKWPIRCFYCISQI